MDQLTKSIVDNLPPASDFESSSIYIDQLAEGYVRLPYRRVAEEGYTHFVGAIRQAYKAQSLFRTLSTKQDFPAVQKIAGNIKTEDYKSLFELILLIESDDETYTRRVAEDFVPHLDSAMRIIAAYRLSYSLVKNLPAPKPAVAKPAPLEVKVAKRAQTLQFPAFRHLPKP